MIPEEVESPVAEEIEEEQVFGNILMVNGLSYTLLSVVYVGFCSVVYRAICPRTSRVLALKILHPGT